MNRLLTVLLASVFFAGCARFVPQPISPDKTAAGLESRSLTNAVIKAFLEKNLRRELADWPQTQWDFEMLTLAAFYYQPSLDVARADWRAAEGGIVTAGERPNPSVAMSGGFDNGIPGNFSPWQPAVTLDVPLETAGKRKRRIEQAKFQSESARLSVATAAWQVRSELRLSLIDLVSARQRVELLSRQVAIQEEVNERLKSQLEAGAIATAELSAGHIALARARADFADAQSQLADAGAHVATAIGVPVAALNTISIQFDLSGLPQADRLTSAEARSVALRSRSDILSALADYAASQSALQLEIAKQYPDVHLNPGYLWNNGNAGDNEWQIGVTVDLPVLNQNQGPIAEAKAKRDATAARFLQLQAKVIGDIDRAVVVYDANRKNLTALESLAEAQKKQHDNVEAQFKAGAADRLELLSSDLDLNTASLSQLDAEVKLSQAAGALEDAVQRPLSGEVNNSIFFEDSRTHATASSTTPNKK